MKDIYLYRDNGEENLNYHIILGYISGLTE